MRDFGDDVFEGTAKYYAKYRSRYPKTLLAEIIQTFKLDGKGRLLDLGCGTGELTIPLAKYFTSVLAIDPDEGMLREGQKKIKKSKINNIIWQKGSSKELDKLKDPFRLVVIGGSFHWMDQEVVLSQLYTLVETGGGVVIIGGAKPLSCDPEASEKDKIVQGVIKKYLGEDRRAGKFIYTHPEKSFEEYLQNSKFRDFRTHYYKTKFDRTADQIIGQLFSTSFASKKQLGENTRDFENELREKLQNLSHGTKFSETLEFSLFTVRK
ncbi:methyltransferase domain-containing protein [Candidatus Saccharibacteria bacterium]|nr:methyltransferase domain-containing protein [Candidatus Saccharibacteria bacterium]